jgi:hypothetical protein
MTKGNMTASMLPIAAKPTSPASVPTERSWLITFVSRIIQQGNSSESYLEAWVAMLASMVRLFCLKCGLEAFIQDRYTPFNFGNRGCAVVR